MTILQAGKKLSQQLRALYDEREAANITNLVMEKITGLSPSGRIVHKHAELNPIQQDQLNLYTQQLLQHRPVQYVLHEAWFAGMRFYVDENVLIPRPETEELVEWIAAEIDPAHQQLSFLDIGTGSGCIAAALKKKLPESIAYALDISSKSLEIARLNASNNLIKIKFLKANILEQNSYEGLPKLDIIVSNPPYIKQSESAAMQPNVLKYEPHNALFVPDEDALLFYKAIVDFALRFLKPGGKLYFEVNELLGEQVAALLSARKFSAIKIKKDLQVRLWSGWGGGGPRGWPAAVLDATSHDCS